MCSCYLFRNVLHCISNTESRDSRIRSRTIIKLNNEWEHCKDRIVSIVNLSMINIAKFCKNFLSREGGIVVEMSNWHKLALCFLTICLEFILKIAPIPFILAVYIIACVKLCITYFVKIENLLKKFLNNFMSISLARILRFLRLVLLHIYFTGKLWQVPT